MFDWLKRRPAAAPAAIDENERLKLLTQEADQLAAAGRSSEARERYETVLRADPKDLYVIYQLATLLQDHGDFAEAQRIGDQGLTLAPDQLGLRARRASICHDRGHHLTALA